MFSISLFYVIKVTECHAFKLFCHTTIKPKNMRFLINLFIFNRGVKVPKNEAISTTYLSTFRAFWMLKNTNSKPYLKGFEHYF